MPNKDKLIGADYLLLLLYLDQKRPIKSAVRLTKMMFIFNKEIVPLLKDKGLEISETDLPNFLPYNYGPFSKDVYEQIELFQSIDFIKVHNLKNIEEMDEVDDWEENAFDDEIGEHSSNYESKRDGKFMKYELLSRGEDYVCGEIKPKLTTDQIEILTTFKQRINSTSIKTILKYVYSKYPDMTENSLIKDEVLGQ